MKKDLTDLHEFNAANSMASKKTDRQRAIANLEKAKAIPRKVILLKQGEGEYSKELKVKENPSEMLISRAAADYVQVSYHAFARRLKKINIPFILKRGNHKYFKITDLDKFKNQFTNG